MNKQRLEQLATHLETGVLGHKVFDIKVLNALGSGPVGEPNICGTHGCAMGEFPKDWSLLYAVRVWLNLDRKEMHGLFWTSRYNDGVVEPWNSEPLDGLATRYDVAASIRRFIAWKEAQ